MKIIFFATAMFAMSFASAQFAHSAKVAAPQKLKQSELKIGKVKIKVEVARTQEQLSKGLMYRQELPAEEGMLFIFDRQERLSFWMKNTFIALDIGFFDKNRRLVDIQSMQPVKSEMQTDIPSVESRKPATYALEVNRGWFARHKIKLGQKFELIERKP
jgi:uncharacterized protein